MRMCAETAERSETRTNVLLWLGAWLVPGGGHLWLGRRREGAIYLAAITVMFGLGLAFHGRLFPFEFSQPLVGLAALANLGMGLPYFLARALGLGGGDVVVSTYEYANAFLIASGLLNMLVVLDAHDVASGRK